MNKQKTKFGEALLEALLEILLVIICFAVGAFVMHLFGVDFAEIDADLLILIGIAIFVVLFVLVSFVVKGIKKLSNKNANNDQPTE
ncbi:MAG: hypothetical protein IJX23_01375 [Clostridia bacterium]|nr:hypothetical protein [Clostridia bacterium]